MGHRRDEPSLEARETCSLSRRVIDRGCQRDEAYGILARLAVQSARKIVGVFRKTEIHEDDSGGVIVIGNQCSSRAAYCADVFVPLLRQHARELSAYQAVLDRDQNSRVQAGRRVGWQLGTARFSG